METQSVKLTILYSVEQEIRRVLYTVQKFSWYAEQGYSIESIKLPEGIHKDSSNEEIARAVTVEYSSTDYALCAAKLLEEWKNIPSGFEKMKDTSFHLESGYGVLLTKYGMKGSYDVNACQVIIRMNTQPEGNITGVVAHEIVHMTIQHLIDQYHVRHWRKERLVDLLMERYFPGLKKMQATREDVSMVDHAFEKFFPNMSAIAQSIGESGS